MRTNPRLVAVIVLCACGEPGRWVEREMLVPSVADPDAGERLEVHIDGDLVLVGGRFRNEVGAVVFARDGETWVEEQVLAVDGLQQTASFGAATALSGETAVVGAPGVDPGGAAWVFTRGEPWVAQQKLEPADPVGRIGQPVALSGETVISGHSFSGLVAVFERADSAWTEQERWSPAGAATDYGEITLAISGETAIVGVDVGAADLYERSGDRWRFQQRVEENDTGRLGLFGISVALSGDTALVGSRYSDGSQYDTGLGYVFVRRLGRWHVQGRLAAEGGTPESGFGYPVALDGDLALVAAPWEDQYAGAVYVFDRHGGRWKQIQRLTASDAAPGMWFGASVAVSGRTALVGTIAGPGVYVFEY